MGSAPAVDSDRTGSPPVKDVVAENFGLVIAYLIPGFVGLWAAAYFSPAVRSWFAGSGQPASIGGILILVIIAPGVGVFLSGLRWIVFEELIKIGKGDPCLGPYDESRLEIPAVKAAVAEIRDQHYRYYQFYANTAVALPFVLIAWWMRGNGGFWLGALALVAALAAEAVLYLSARNAFQRDCRKRFKVLGPVKPAKE